MHSSLFPEYGHSWKYCKSKKEIESNKYIHYKDFPFPDGIRNGPIIEAVLTKNSKHGVDNFDCHARIKQVKEITAKFPLQTSVPTALPFEIPSSSKIRNNFTECEYHSNLLHTVLFNGFYYLVYVMNKSGANKYVKVAKINNEDKFNNIKCFYSLNNEKTLVEYSDILNIDAKSIGNESYILVQSSDKISIHSLNEKWKNNEVNTLNIYNAKYSCLHPIFKNNFAVTNLDSTVCIYDIHKNSPLWCGTFSLNQSEKRACDTFYCEFGNHPLYLYVTSNSTTWLTDFRMPSNSRKLLNIKEMNNCINYEEVIYSIKSIPSLPYLFVNCSESLILMDNRYCKVPVITWNHMMLNNPKFPKLYYDGDRISLLLADSKLGSLCVIPLKHSNECHIDNKQRIEAISTPKHFNILKDTLHYAHSNGVWINIRQSFINEPLVGMTPVQFQSKSKQNLVCFENNKGILFYQPMTSDNYTKDSCDEFVSIMKRFEKSILINRKEIKHLSRKEVKNFNHLKKVEPLNRNIYTDTIYRGPIWQINGTLKNKKKTFFLYEFEADEKVSKSLLKNRKYSAIDFLPEKYHKSLNIETIKNSPDLLSKKIFRLWDRSFNSVSYNELRKIRGYVYKRKPLGINEELTIPYIKSEDGDLSDDEPLNPPTLPIDITTNPSTSSLHMADHTSAHNSNITSNSSTLSLDIADHTSAHNLNITTNPSMSGLDSSLPNTFEPLDLNYNLSNSDLEQESFNNQQFMEEKSKRQSIRLTTRKTNIETKPKKRKSKCQGF